MGKIGVLQGLGQEIITLYCMVFYDRLYVLLNFLIYRVFNSGEMF